MAACMPIGGDGPTWDNLDFEDFKERFKAPTGELTKESFLELAGHIETIAADLAVIDGVGPIIANINGNPGEAGGALSVQQSALTLENDHAYMKISCPGPDTQTPDVSFKYGHLRIDTHDIIKNKLASGDALLSFIDCVISQSELAGKAPAYFDSAESLLAIAVDITVKQGGNVRALVMDVIAEKGQFWTLLNDNLGRSYALLVDPKSLPDAITLKDKNGLIGCEKTEGGVTCTGPGGWEVSF
jgi:hypothetical protein